MFSIQKKSARILLACVALSFMLSACGTASGSPDQAGGDSAPQQSIAQGSGTSSPDQQLGFDIDHADTQPVDQEAALALAFENASVPQEDAYHVQIKQDTEGGIPVYKIEFETQYGDYDFEVSIADGRIVGADYEVDEEWLDTLGGSPVTLEEAKDLVMPAPRSCPTMMDTAFPMEIKTTLNRLEIVDEMFRPAITASPLME